MNICKVEIFNEDGSLAQSEERHNYVTQGQLGSIEAYARRFLLENPSGSSFTSSAASLMGKICATNNTDAIDTAEQQFEFNSIAWSHTTTTTGSDSRQGSLNQAESYENNAQMKLVFDFPTDRGNGTFQTLHLCNEEDLTLTDSYINGLSKSFYYEGGNLRGLCSDSTYFYTTDDIDKSVIRRFSKTTFEYVDDIAISSAVPSTQVDIAIDGTYFYITANDNIYKYTLAGSAVTSSYINAISGVTYISPYLYYNRSNSYYKMDTDFTNQTLLGSSLTGYRMTNDGTDLYVSASPTSYIHKVSSSDGSTLAIYGDPLLGTYGIDYKDTSTLYCAQYGLGELDIGNAFNVATRVRLDSAVTKNSSQTMKITYTMNFS